MKIIIVLSMVALLSSDMSTTLATSASFQGLGDLPGGEFQSYVQNISADGRVVVGVSISELGSEAYIWTQDGGMVGLGHFPGGSLYSGATGISDDGSVIVGYSHSASGREAFNWTGTMVGLGDLPGGKFSSTAHDISGNGLVVVGETSSSASGSGWHEAFRWTEEQGMQGLGTLPSNSYISEAYGVSGDGSIVVGQAHSDLGYQAFKWDAIDGIVGMGDLAGGQFWSGAYAISYDGSVIVGQAHSVSGSEAFRWTQATGMVGLGDLPGGGFSSYALGISSDGSVILGGGVSESGDDAFIWTQKVGMVSIRDLLVNIYGLNLTGWTLTQAWDISEDGITIVGRGINPDGYTEAWIATIPEPSMPPVADADGPYSILVGDTLTLDASGSIDDDNDIVLYMWDLDDDGSFETDAGGQATFDVSYAYLQLLGLIVDHTYNIHVQVTDSEGQSDVADSTLIIVPKPAIVVAVDIKPGSCPNPVNVKSSGVLPVAILGSDDYDVNTIVPTSIRLAGVEPLRNSFEDVAGPVADSNDCNCTEAGPDGFPDLTLKFNIQRIVEALGDVNDGDVRVLTLTGILFDPVPFETPIEGADCILIRGKAKPMNKADINKDGLVNMADLSLMIGNWLKSSIVEE